MRKKFLPIFRVPTVKKVRDRRLDNFEATGRTRIPQILKGSLEDDDTPLKSEDPDLCPQKNMILGQILGQKP